MARAISKALRKPQTIAFFINPIELSPKPTHPISPFSTFSRNLSCSSSSVSQSQEKQSGRWSRWLLFLPGAVTFGLGTWQIFRRQEKIEMIDYRRKRLELEPIPLNIVSPSDGDLLSTEFRRVAGEGVYDETRSIYIGPRSRSISGVTENGYYIVTPLTLTLNKPDSVQLQVLVNRGWVPRSWRDKQREDSQDREKSSDAASLDAGENESSFWRRLWSNKPKAIKDQEPTITPVKLIGVVRGSEKPSIFVPANDPNTGQWFYVDVPAIARAAGLPENTIYIEDINEVVDVSQPYPIPKDVNTLIRYSVMPQDHLNYTLTWYSLSAAVTFMAFKRLKPEKRRR